MSPGARLEALSEGMGGAQGGVLAAIATMPLEIVVFRQAADPDGATCAPSPGC